MHTKQLFPAVCFCKDLIPDALIFLLWLNTLFKQDFFAFLGFHKWSLTFLPHCRVFVLPGFSLHPPPPPPPSAPNLWLLLLLFQIAWAWYFIMGTNGATIMILEIYTYTPTLPLITFIIHGMSLKIKVTQSPLEESRKRPGHGEQD